jgi:hypothetical protein
MNIQSRPSRAGAWLLRRLLVLVGAFGLCGATANANTVADDRLALESRVQTVRQDIQAVAADETQSVQPVTAQWGNWGNWRNAWNNWGNWRNR